MTERSACVRVLFKAPHVRACPRPDRPTRPYPTDQYPTGQLLEVITARLNYAEHDFLTTEKLGLTIIRNSYHLSPNSNHRPRTKRTTMTDRLLPPIDALVLVRPIDGGRVVGLGDQPPMKSEERIEVEQVPCRLCGQPRRIDSYCAATPGCVADMEAAIAEQREWMDFKPSASTRPEPYRIALRPDEPGKERLDDIVVRDVSMFRLEMMDVDTLWMACYFPDTDQRLSLWVHVVQKRGQRRQLVVTATEQPSDALFSYEPVPGVGAGAH